MADETHEDAQALAWDEPDDEAAARSAIFNAKDLEEVIVPVPAWGMHVMLRALTGAERASITALLAGGKSDPRVLYAELVLLSCRHPKTGKLIFKAADRDSLMSEKSGAVIEELALTAQQLSKLDGSAREAAAKNLAAARSTATTS